MGSALCSGEKKRKYPGLSQYRCQNNVKTYPFLMPNLVLGLTQTVEVRYTKCVIKHIKDFLDFMTLLFKLSLLSLNGGLCIRTAFKKQKVQLWNKFQWDVEMPELALTMLQ